MDVTSYLLGKKSGGGGSSDLSEYFGDTLSQGSSSTPGWLYLIKKLPSPVKMSGTNLNYAFSNYRGETLPNITFLSTNIMNLQSMFQDCRNLTKIKLDNLDTSSVNYMQTMFYGCSSLTEIDISSFDTHNVVNMNGLFSGCSNLITLKCNLDLSSCANINNLFYQCTKLTNVGKVSNIGKAFLTTAPANNNNYTLRLQGYGWTQESLANIINGLYDIASAGVQPQKITMELGVQERLTQEQKDIIASRGWTLATY